MSLLSLSASYRFVCSLLSLYFPCRSVCELAVSLPCKSVCDPAVSFCPSDQSVSLLSFSPTDLSVSLLSLVVTACGLALFGVSLFVSWKLCWLPWRERGISPSNKPSDLQPRVAPSDTGAGACETHEDCNKPASPGPDHVHEVAMKISHTSPDIPLEGQAEAQKNQSPRPRIQRQSTEPTSSSRLVPPYPIKICPCWCKSIRNTTYWK